MLHNFIYLLHNQNFEQSIIVVTIINRGQEHLKISRTFQEHYSRTFVFNELMIISIINVNILFH